MRCNPEQRCCCERAKKKANLVVDFFVARPGFEPRQTEPKSVVLPLYYRAKTLFIKADANLILLFG